MFGEAERKHTRRVLSLCGDHARELWKEMGPLCSAGLGHWTNLTMMVQPVANSWWTRLKYLLHELNTTHCTWSDVPKIWWESRVLPVE